MKDPYKILGVNPTATPDEIKKAYRKLAMEHHPDRTGGDDAKFKEIADAYDILTNPNRKNRSGYQPNDIFDNSIFEDFLKNTGFADMFNNRYGWQQTGKGRDVRIQIQIPLEDAYFGTSRDVRIGLKSTTVNIPPGVVNGQKIKIPGLGQRGMSEDLHGDLVVIVVIIDHKDYLLDNRGLHKIHKINVFDAILGGKSMIDVFDKKITFTIPQGTQNGSILRIQGKGFPLYNQNDKYSDLYINVIVDIPTDLNEDELSKLRELKYMIDERRK